MRVASTTIYCQGKVNERGPIYPRADALKTGLEYAQMIAHDERVNGCDLPVLTLAPTWPVLAHFAIDTPAGRFTVRVRDAGSL